MFRKELIILVSAAALSSCIRISHKEPCQTGMDGEILSRCDSTINAGIARRKFPGAVLCIVKDGCIVHEKAYGSRCLVPKEEEMTADAVFDLASLSKCVGTTLSVMKLMEQGSLSPEDRVDSFLPQFRNYTDSLTGEETPVLIKHLMTHTSGLAAYPDVAAFARKYGENCPDSLLRHIACELPRIHKPGEGMTYSCPNFITLQYILESVTGRRLCDFAYRNIYRPLGLKHTMYLPTGEKIPSRMMPLLVPTEVRADGKPFVGQVHDPVARRFNMGNSGNAGVFSDAEDLAVICSMILDRGVWNGRRILSEESVRMMTEIPHGLEQYGRTAGWDSSSSSSDIIGKLREGGKCICHTGYTGTSIVLDFNRHIAIILLTNRVHPEDKGSIGDIRRAVSDIVFDSLGDGREGDRNNYSRTQRTEHPLTR